MRGIRTGFVAALLLQGCLTEEGFDPPVDGVEDAAGAFVVRRDNPFLQGRIAIRVASVDLAPSPFVDARTMTPDGAFIIVDPPTRVFDWSSGVRGWLWSGETPGAVTLGATPFLAPAVRLPMDYAPMNFTLITQRGREFAGTPEDPESLPPLGFDVRTIDSQTVRLDTNVLVLPVRLTMFVAGDGSFPVRFPSPQVVSAIFDPGAVSTISAGIFDDGLVSSVLVHSGQYAAGGAPQGYEDAPPDNIWTQCDIQFRLEELEVIPQDAGLERQLLSDCRCGYGEMLPDPNVPVTGYITQGRDGNDMVQIFLGGTIANCPGEITYGLTCGGPTHTSTYCPTEIRAIGVANAIFVDAGRMHERDRVVAHELGHLLGLEHPRDAPDTCYDASTAGSDNLMTTGAVGGVLTAEQCARARCIALQWLDAYGRLPPGHTRAVCSRP